MNQSASSVTLRPEAAEAVAAATLDNAPHPQPALDASLPTPPYLEKHYWWAYLHPRGVRFFDRLWMVNAILFGNFNALRDEALRRLGERIDGHMLQVAAVYGDITPKIAERLAPGASLTLVDIAPIQLQNVARKLPLQPRVSLQQQDSTALDFADGQFDTVLLFFLLHEQPDDIKYQTCAEALRVLKPGGRLLVVDYHQPKAWHPFRYLLKPFLRVLEPFSLALWGKSVRHWFPASLQVSEEDTRLFFGGLYQVTEMRVQSQE